MTTYKVSFWVNGHEAVETYEVDADTRDDAVEAATQKLRDDGYDSWNLKQVSTA